MANKESAELTEPCVGALDDPAALVSSELAAVLVASEFAVLSVRDDPLDAAFLQPLAQRVGVVGAVGDHPFRLLPGTASGPGDADFGERGLRKTSFSRRGTFEPNSQWKTAAVDQYHPLRALAPLGFANSSAPFFADTKLPSRNVSSQSSSWSWFSAANIALQAWSQTPCSSHCRNLRQQVGPLGYSEGRSRHRAPVRSTHRMPSTHSRFEAQGRPRLSRRRFGAGKKYSINAHCRSLSRMLPAQPIPAPIGKCLP